MSAMKSWTLLLTAAGLVGVLTGCAGSKVQTVQIEIQNMTFSTKEITLKQGVPAKLVLVNKDVFVHDLSVDDIQVTALKSGPGTHEHIHYGNQPDLHTSAGPGETGTVEFTPTAAGSYVFYCTLPGHQASGMQGTLIVSKQ